MKVVAILALLCGTAAAQSSPDTWAPMAGFPTNVSSTSAFAAAGNGEDIYAIISSYSPYNGLYRYRVSTSGPWEEIGSGPGIDVASMACSTQDRMLYVAGAWSGYATMYRRSLDGTNWLSMPLPAGESYCRPRCLQLSGRSLFFLGVSTLHRFVSGEVGIVDHWEPVNTYPTGVVLGTGACADLRDEDGTTFIYFMPGGGRQLWKMPVTGAAWTRLADAPDSLYGGGAFCFASNRFAYAFRGSVNTGSLSKVVWRYDVVKDEWISVAPLSGSFGVYLGSALLNAGDGEFLYGLPGQKATFWRYALRNDAPEASGAGQEQLDGSASIGTAAVIDVREFAVTARMDDINSDSGRLEVEIQPLGTDFTGVATASGDVAAAGSGARIPVSGLAAGTAYHWQVRPVDRKGLAGAWVSYGGNAETEADIAIRTNADPAVDGLAQGDAGGALPIGGTTFSSGRDHVDLKARVSDVDAVDLVRIEVEIRRAGEEFQGTPTASSAAVPPGSDAEIRISLAAGDYRWAVRSVDLFGAASPWVDFGGNGTAADFHVAFGGSSGANACLGSAPGGGSIVIVLTLLILARRIR